MIYQESKKYSREEVEKIILNNKLSKSENLKGLTAAISGFYRLTKLDLSYNEDLLSSSFKKYKYK